MDLVKKIKIRYLPYLINIPLRLLVPFFIWQHAFITTCLVTFLDGIDGDLFRFATLSRKGKVYQKIDKILDFYWYTFILVYIWESSLSSLFLAFWLFRFLGMTLFLIGKNRKILFFFPNLFENLFFAYIIAKTFPSFSFLLEKGFFPKTLLIVFFSKMIQEYILHIKQFSFHDYFISGLSFHDKVFGGKFVED